MSQFENKPLGARPLDDGRIDFRVWAPRAESVEVSLVGDRKQIIPMLPTENGYFELNTAAAQINDLYYYRLNGETERPDPTSRHQPQGVHGPSQIVRQDFDWHDANWKNHALRDYILYELHVGTFTEEGTFDAIITQLDMLFDLGVNALSLMPVAQFPGGRNWGYDGVQLYAVQNSYGGPEGLKRLVDACHQRDIAVILDVVYNHLGPEGNYLHDYAPYFTDRYRGGWGDVLNFDGEHSDHVRHFFIENAITWARDFHIDGFRLDATHALYDLSAYTFLEELGERVHEWAAANRRWVHLIAENDKSDVRLTRPREAGGDGIDAQWLDDMHHVLHVHFTGENDGYYADYGDFDQLVKVFRQGFVHSGDYSQFRKRTHGTSSLGVPGDRFVVATQTHDQVGNRMLGERLTELVDFDSLKLAAAAVIWSPYVPMLFMGEEYGETAPFQYFISHTDSGLVEAVQKGRAEEFSSFAWKGTPPDPYAVETFERSTLNHALRGTGHHRTLYEFYKALINLRKTIPALNQPDRHALDVWHDRHQQVICLQRHAAGSDALVIYNFNLQDSVNLKPPISRGQWHKNFDSTDPQWREADESPTNATPDTIDSDTTLELVAKSFVLYVKEESF